MANEVLYPVRFMASDGQLYDANFRDIEQAFERDPEGRTMPGGRSTRRCRKQPNRCFPQTARLAIFPPSVNDAVKAGGKLALVEVPLRNGTILRVRRCLPAEEEGPWTKYAKQAGAQPDKNIFDELAASRIPRRASGKDCLYFVGPEPPTLGAADQVAIEKDYWVAYNKWRHEQFVAEMLGTLFFGLWGFPAGLGLWIFYRLVLFAVEG